MSSRPGPGVTQFVIIIFILEARFPFSVLKPFPIQNQFHTAHNKISTTKNRFQPEFLVAISSVSYSFYL